MSQFTDSELYEKVQTGDRHAIEQLYDKYEKILFSFSYKMTNQRETAEEVVQEVMIKVWKGQGNFQASKGKFSSWLLTVARNSAIDIIRKKKEPTYEFEDRDSLASDETSTEDLIEWKETGDQLRRMITQLKEDQQEIIHLFYFEGLTQRKIADRLDIPLGTVKGRVRLALQHLRKLLQEEERGVKGYE